jgi:hypothetical protein
MIWVTKTGFWENAGPLRMEGYRLFMHIRRRFAMKTMANKKNWLGMLVVVLVFAMAGVGCDNGSTDGSSGDGQNWVKAEGELAEPFTGILSDNNTTLTTAYAGWRWTFTKTGGSLDGVWQDGGSRLTISGTNWTLSAAKGTLTVNGTSITFIAEYVIEEMVWK